MGRNLIIFVALILFSGVGAARTQKHSDGPNVESAVAYELARQASKRTLGTVELRTVAADKIGTFVYLEAALHDAVRGAKSRHAPLPTAGELAPLNTAMKDLLIVLQRTKDATWVRDYYTSHGYFGHWAATIAFDGHPPGAIRDLYQAEGYRVENNLVWLYYSRLAREPKNRRERVRWWIMSAMSSRADGELAIIRLGELPGDARLAIDELLKMTADESADDILPLMVALMSAVGDRRVLDIPDSYIDSAASLIRFQVRRSQARAGIPNVGYTRAAKFHKWTGSRPSSGGPR